MAAPATGKGVGAWSVAYRDAAIAPAALWSSPFARWRGALSRVSSLDLAVAVARTACDRREVPLGDVAGLVLGWTVPPPDIFYGGPSVARRLGLPAVTGPMVSQACATSVAALHAAASAVTDTRRPQLVLVTDRVSNGPELRWPASGPDGGPREENWVRDAFARDPETGRDMLATAETVARDAGFTRGDADALAALRHEQYRSALDDDRAIQRRYMVEVDATDADGSGVRLGADQGVRPATADALAAEKASRDGGVHTRATQTYPADGTAGAVVTSRAQAVDIDGSGVARLLSAGFSRVPPGRMPEALVPAALAALDAAGTTIDAVDAVATHNPFAVNDLFFARATGTALDAMNTVGCSLVFGHPQGPTGLRSVAELVAVLHRRGGGTGLFTGCAAGDSGAAVVVRVET